MEELELSLQTPLIPAQCITTVTHREAVRCQWLLFFFFCISGHGTQFWDQTLKEAEKPWDGSDCMDSHRIYRQINRFKQTKKTHMVQSSCCCFPETIKNTAVRNTVALSHMCLPYCEHTLIPHTLMKDHRKILSQSNQSQTN